MIKDFKALKLTLASPQQILTWSHGEVRKAETINYRTHKAEVDGLMDEKIFGPTKNYECYCGKYKKIRYKGIICDKCGVEVTHKRVRRERLGHIKLAAPVTHVWYAYGVPNKLALILDIPQKKLETVIYFSRYLVIQANQEDKKAAAETLAQTRSVAMEEITNEEKAQLETVKEKFKKEKADLKKKAKGAEAKLDMQLNRLDTTEKREIAKLRSIYDKRTANLEAKFNVQAKLIESIDKGMTLSEEEYGELMELGVDFFDASMGAEAIYKLLSEVEVRPTIERLKEELNGTKSQLKLRRITQRLRIFEGMVRNDIEPKWMVMHNVPVIPPDLRPIIQLPGGRFATSDLNDLYRRVINRNNRLKKLMDLGAPEIILRNEKRMLQEAVDALIDNSHRPGNAVQNSRQQPYKSLSDMLRGKQGRFRQNLLGKRVDFSGRSVIVAGPELSVDQCGLPKTMALELFKPFVMHEIISRGLASNIRSAKNVFDEKSDEIWDILEQVIDKRPVLLNRAPTLHRQGIQAFFPVLVEGNAIRLHPLVCKGFNADFDGDQMAVHVPLSQAAIDEVIDRMFTGNNILLMADGKPVVNAEKDMAYGVYYLTEIPAEELAKEPTKSFNSIDRAIGAFNANEINLREQIFVLANDGVEKTTVGRLIFNNILPKGYRFINEQLNKKAIAKISANILEKFGADFAIKFLDSVEKVGFKYATYSGFSIGMDDFIINPIKDDLLAEITKKEEELATFYEQGFVSATERRKLFEQEWMKIVERVSKATWENYLAANNNLVKLNESGAAPVENPISQISGVRGLIVDPSGRIVELPLRSNYKQGLSSLEYFVAARGTRKALADVALKTAESGYLTRKLVDVAQDVITRIDDCETELGIHLYRDDLRRIDFVDRITGRWAAETVKAENGEVLVEKNNEITSEIAAEIASEEFVQVVKVRSVITCSALDGVCSKCYGYDLGTHKLAKAGVAMGVIAAQSIGEASTQLTLHAKHRSGSASAKDITQGIPRVEELLETRSPKGKAILAEQAGTVEISKDEAEGKIIVRILGEKNKQRKYSLEGATEVKIKRVKKVKQGDQLFTDAQGNAVSANFTGEARIEDGNIVLASTERDETVYELDIWSVLAVKSGDKVVKGQQVTQGSVDPRELMELSDLETAQNYIINNVQDTFGVQGIAIDDKHMEVIVRQMSRFVQISNPGDSDNLPGDYLDHRQFDHINRELDEAGKSPIRAKRQLMGISNASLRTESFLSAASFQDQVRVLTDAAIVGKIDNLGGLKENVIIGRPVPLGAGITKGVGGEVTAEALQVEKDSHSESQS